MSNPRFKFPEALVLLRDGTVLIAGGAQQPEVYDPSITGLSQRADAWMRLAITPPPPAWRTALS